MSEFESLPKESFIPAKWLGPENELSGVPPRWQGYSADLPGRDVTTLYPLRVSNYGEIPPHKYAARMHRQDGSGKNGALTMVNLHVNMLYEHNGSYDHDYPTEHFRSLLDDLDKKPYDERPELVAMLQGAFEGYKDIREEQRIKIAKGLSRTISRAELYIVAADSADWRTSSERALYTLPLSGIVNVRKGHRMNYKVVVKDRDGKEGFLPSTFFAPGGVCAPVAQ